MTDDGLLDAVAIVGLSCRIPGARDAAQLWHNLAAGVESITRFSNEELRAAGADPETIDDPAYVPAAGVLDGIDLFDADLFGFSRREAELTDPQQRLFLECAWEALEDAGYGAHAGRERIGVFAGARLDTYWLGFFTGREGVHSEDGLRALLGNDKDHLATQVSYRLDLRGPSIGVQTACSTSLVAVALASQALVARQCDLALAGGVTVRVPQKSGHLFRAGGLGSPDGHCRAFSAEAQGSVFGSGLGVVVLERLDEALEKGDHVRAVIRGTAINNDGALKAGYTAPSEEGQAEVIATAQAIAGVEPDTIGYVEAHGTGTALGDPIEVAALTRAFRAGTARRGFCALGSIETNIGHLDCAAGVAGLIKTTLALEHGQIPPSLHFRAPNPAIDFAASPFYVNTELRSWPAGGPRRAGVSSFGVGGTNVHVVLEEAPEALAPGPARAWHLLPVSARTPAALEAATRRLADHLRAHPELAAADVAYTLQVGRRALRHRRAVVCRDLAEAREALETLPAESVWTGVEERRGCPVLFLIPDGGEPVWGPGAELYRCEASFRADVDRATELLARRSGGDLRSLFAPGEATSGERAAVLPEAGLERAAPLAFAYALARLWISWGVAPRAILGTGLGELAGACLDGALSLDDALARAAARDAPAGGAPRLADDAREQLTGRGQVVLELGPGGALAALLGHPPGPAAAPPLVTSLPAPDAAGSGDSVLRHLIDALGRLWLAGVPIDWHRFHAGARRRRLPLPTYPFERRSYWLERLAGAPAAPRSAAATGAAEAAPLPRPDLQVPYAAPRSATERRLAELWQRLLGIVPVGLDDDFFELGGHSLLAVRLAGELRSLFGARVPVAELFAAPTVSSLAARIDAARGAAEPAVDDPIEAAPRDGDLPLSFAQERHWFLARLEPDSPLYNHAAGLRLDGALDVPAFAHALEEIVRRHEPLRSTFFSVDGAARQRIAPPGRRTLPVADLSGLSPALQEAEAPRLGRSEARRPFDLARGPLLRCLLVRFGRQAHGAYFVIHHIAGDQWSAGVLVREIAALYSAFSAGRPSPLPAMPVQYADFARWQRRRLRGEVLETELAYWRERLGGRLPVLDLPADRPRRGGEGSAGGSAPFELAPELSRRVRDLARSAGATPFMVLLAGLLALLHRLTGELDLIVGAPVAGRDRPELDGLIGCFINAVALRTDLSGDPAFGELIARVREVALGAFAHQELPFEKLVEKLEPNRHPGRSPVFQVVFNYQNAAPAGPSELLGLTLRQIPAELGTAKYDLTLYMWEAPDRLAGAFEYKTDLFEPATVARWRDGLVILLERAVAAPETRLSALVAALGAQETEKRIMRQDEVSASNLKKLKITRRRAVNLAQEELVRSEQLDGTPLPLVFRPNVEDVDLSDWAARNGARIERELLVHGGILFRGFAVRSPQAFERFVNSVTTELVNYVEGSSPRVMVGDKVYTSTEYPPEFFVSMHNELSYAHKWPSKIFFYCDTEPAEGGETPIADSREVWRRIDPAVRRRFEEKGLVYTRNLHGDTGAGLSWQTVFETTDRSRVEAYCEEGGIEYRWTDDGGLRTRQRRPATIKHPETGEPVWFNQVDQWHPSNLGEELAAALLATTKEEDLPINASFGDGDPLDPEELDHVRGVFRETLVTFPWRQGDVLMLDNTLAAHGRMPFKPPRRVLVAMGGGTVRLDALEA